jgi:hypothetical protein
MAAATPATAAATPPQATSGSYGIPSDAGSHGSLYAYFFGQNGKPPGMASEKPVPVTSYGIPADAGSQGSLYTMVFGSKSGEDKDAGTPVPSAAASAPAPTPSR